MPMVRSILLENFLTFYEREKPIDFQRIKMGGSVVGDELV